MTWVDLSDSELNARLEQRGVINALAIVRNRDDERVAEYVAQLLDE